MPSRDFGRVRRTLQKKLSADLQVPINRVNRAYLRLSDEERDRIIDEYLLEFGLELPESCSVYENLRSLGFFINYICNESRREYHPTTPNCVMA